MSKYTFYTVEPWRLHTSLRMNNEQVTHSKAPVSRASTRTQGEGYQGQGRGRPPLNKRITPQGGGGHVIHSPSLDIY